jgi:hypothetical protein
MCKHYASPEIPLTKVLSLLLFGSASSKKKKIVNTIITRNSSTSSLDLSVSVSDNHKETINLNKETCLMNCKNILFQIENEFLKET